MVLFEFGFGWTDEETEEETDEGETSERGPIPSLFGAEAELLKGAEARFGRVETGTSRGVVNGFELKGTRDRRMPNA